MAAIMNFDDFEARLSTISRHDGRPYGRAYGLFAAQQKHAEAAAKVHGHLVLSDAFKCFIMETVELLNGQRPSGVPAGSMDAYGFFVPQVIHSFQSLCGAEQLAIRGYPLQAYTLLRNIFDCLQLVSAAAQQFTTFHDVEGLVRGEPIIDAQVRRRRKKTERAVRESMSGKASGLSTATIEELARWDELFDLEVHGARLSLSQSLGWLQGTESLPIMPRFSTPAYANFVNRWGEIAWMVHRLVPLMQRPNACLSDSWKQNWTTVDGCFDYSVTSLTRELGKPIGAAIAEYVTCKFPFGATSTLIHPQPREAGAS
jgi:hypothetical protein